MAQIRVYEEQACSTVYYKSTAERCDLLATQLTAVEYVEYTSPPSLPPAQPMEVSPEPPSSPPMPNLPDGLVKSPVAGVTLPTIRMPLEDTSEQSTATLVRDGYYFASGVVFDAAAYGALPFNSRAKCVDVTISSTNPGALPCVSAALVENCVDYRAPCGTVEENTKDIMLEIELDGRPVDRRAYPWAVRVFLPETEELARLFFDSAEAEGGSGYEVRLLDGDGAPITNEGVPSPESGLPEDRELLITLVSPTAEADEISRLSRTRFVQIQLHGRLRQLWLKEVAILERPLAAFGDLAGQPPSLPPRPLFPDRSPSPPSQDCEFHSGEFLAHEEIDSSFQVGGCGMDQHACCFEAQNALTRAGLQKVFLLSDGGCCTVLYATSTGLVPFGRRIEYQTAHAGTGLLN